MPQMNSIPELVDFSVLHIVAVVEMNTRCRKLTNSHNSLLFTYNMKRLKTIFYNSTVSFLLSTYPSSSSADLLQTKAWWQCRMIFYCKKKIYVRASQRTKKPRNFVNVVAWALGGESLSSSSSPKATTTNDAIDSRNKHKQNRFRSAIVAFNSFYVFFRGILREIGFTDELRSNPLCYIICDVYSGCFGITGSLSCTIRIVMLFDYGIPRGYI